jgi:hypothetical protein
MPDPSIRTVDNELMVLLELDEVAPVVRKRDRAQTQKKSPTNVSAAPSAAGQIASGTKRSLNKGIGTCGAARR